MYPQQYPRIVLVHGNGLYAKLIRLGARLHKDTRPYAYWNHVSINTEPGVIVEAVGTGVVKRRVSDSIRDQDHMVIPLVASDEDRAEMIAYVNSCVGERYNWLGILSIGLYFLTGGTLSFGQIKETFCSQLAADMLFCGGKILPMDPSDVMPADIGRWVDEGFFGA